MNIAAPSHVKLAMHQPENEADVEFSEKRWVWMPDAKAGYLRGWVVSNTGTILKVRCEDDVVCTDIKRF